MRVPAPNRRQARIAKRQKSLGGVPVYDSASVQACVGGWDAVHPLASMPQDRAVFLDNWFPEPGYIRVRRGHQIHARCPGAGPIESLLAYNGTTSAASKLFAATNNALYDVTASGEAASTTVTGTANNRWQYVNFTTSGGHFLIAVNGADAPKSFDGSTWSSPSITGITASDAININVHKNRIWLVLNNSMDAAYLGTNAISGAATKFPLGAVLSKGGYLVAMATWTHDGGNGPDDYAVFLSSRGQAAVYQGTDPSSTDTWAIVGVYDFGAPLGYRCLTKVAGDLAMVSVDGVLPFSLARGTDRGAAATIAITANINNAMNTAARQYSSNFGWELCPYPRGTAAILNVPVSEADTQHQYVMNTLTGAWCRYTGINSNCRVVFRDELYSGGNAGFVYQEDVTSLDITTPVDAEGQTAYNFYNLKGTLKQFKMIQPILTTDAAARPAVGISTDFKDNALLGTPTAGETASALYDSAVWDVDVYPVESRTIADWTGVTGLGLSGSIHFRSRTGRESGVSIWGVSNWGDDQWSYSVSGEIIMRLNSFNVLYERGGVF